MRLPEDARGLLILTHGKGNVIFLSQENLPTGAERKYTWEEHSGQYTTQLITVYDYESMYMTAVDVEGNESATFVCLCLAQEKGVRFALERNKRMKNDYAIISTMVEYVLLNKQEKMEFGFNCQIRIENLS